MKKLFILLLTTFVAIGTYAQMPPTGGGGGFGGGRGGGGFGGGRPGGGPPSGDRGNFNPQTMNETPVLEYFPEIPNLTLKQRADVGTILTNEQKTLRRLESQKRELIGNAREETELTAKQLEKNRQKLAKIDSKIQKRIDKSNLKIAKKLSADQYQVFLAKRHEFRFGNGRPMMQQPPEGRGAPRNNSGMGPPQYSSDTDIQ